MRKLVYIMGAGRSGTTLLDILLGNAGGIFSAGELNRFPRNEGSPRGSDPGGETGKFWTGFMEALEGAHGKSDFSALRALSMKYEYHKALLRMAGTPDPAYAQYIRNFFGVLFRHAGTDIIVDSSKYPMRGYYLSRLLDCDITYIYLKRDPVDVVRSFARKDIEQPSKGWLMTNLYLLWVHFACAVVLRDLQKRHRVVTVRYGDLVSDPESTLKAIAGALELDLKKVIRLVSDDAPLSTGVLFEGNRIRHEKSIRLRRNATTRTPSLRDRLAGILHRTWWP